MHIYQNSDPTVADADCRVCGGKCRDAIHGTMAGDAALIGVPPVYRYEDWQGGSGEFLTAMHSGHIFECDEEMYYYWLEVLPPHYLKNPVTLPNGEQVRTDFGFAEGPEPITVFWRKNGRYFGCRTNHIGRGS